MTGKRGQPAKAWKFTEKGKSLLEKIFSELNDPRTNPPKVTDEHVPHNYFQPKRGD